MKKMKKTRRKGNTFSYGGIKLRVLDQKHPLVPKSAKEIILQPADRKALAVSLRSNLSCLLIGETGTGKTSAIRHLALLRKQAYVRVNMTGYTSPEELIGSKSAANGSTYYEDGVITHAMKIGAILVIDELNATPPDSVFILHGLLDEDRQITLPNGTIVKPHRDFRIFATMNPDYEGTKAVNRAFLDRFPIILEINTLPPRKEENLLRKRGRVKKVFAEKMVTVASMARKAYLEEKTLTYISTRSLLQWVALVKRGLEPKVAYCASIVKKARKEEQLAFKDFYNAVFKVGSVDNPLDDPTPVVLTMGEVNGMKKRIDDKREKINKLLDTVKELQATIDLTRGPAQAMPLGTKVRAKNGAPYGITTNGWEGKIIEVVKDSERIVVEGHHPKDGSIGKYEVNQRFFIPVRPATPI